MTVRDGGDSQAGHLARALRIPAVKVEFGEPLDGTMYGAVPGVHKVWHPRVEGETDSWAVVSLMLEDGFNDDCIYVVYFDDILVGVTHDFNEVETIMNGFMWNGEPAA